MNDQPDNRSPSPRPVLRAGQVIGGRYRVLGMLGRGGMGVVYAAIHELTQRKVALKVVDSDGSDLPALRDRFLSEARTAAAVRHPNIVDVLDMGMHLGAPYLVMELLEGRALDAIVDEQRALPLHEILGWLFPIIGALCTLHDEGIVHRDIKPSNIFLSHSGRQNILPKLLDFGLARGATDARLTRSGVVIGTPLYMAPEHAAGGHVGPAADIWSMGVVLFECMTGVMPFSSTDRSVLAAQVLAGHVRPIRQVRPDLPVLLAEAVDRALQRDLGQRHSSMRALAQALVKAAVAHDIALPEQPDPLGLPDFQAWRAAAHRPTSQVADTTAELFSEPYPVLVTPSTAAPRTRSVRYGYVAIALFSLLALGTWLFVRARQASPQPLAPALPQGPHDLPATLPGSVSPELAPPSVTELKTQPAVSVTGAKEEPESSPRKSGEHVRRKPRAAATASHPEPTSSPPKPAPPPAEVETEWK